MPKRTTLILDDDVYKFLVEESIKRYGTTRALSRVVNELIKERISRKREFIKLLYSEKYAEITPEEFYEFRRELSRRFETT
jgi:predicted CopG family antitoxin